MLIGPLPYIANKRVINGREYTTYVPNYNHQGVAERIRIEVDMVEDMCYDKRKL